MEITDTKLEICGPTSAHVLLLLKSRDSAMLSNYAPNDLSLSHRTTALTLCPSLFRVPFLMECSSRGFATLFHFKLRRASDHINTIHFDRARVRATRSDCRSSDSDKSERLSDNSKSPRGVIIRASSSSPFASPPQYVAISIFFLKLFIRALLMSSFT